MILTGYGSKTGMGARPVYNVLVLIDNTASMNKATTDGFPFISYAKSAIRAITEERSRTQRFVLTAAFTGRTGRPTFVTCQQAASLSEINYLSVSSSGSFDETVTEGLIEFNRQRFYALRDSSDPFFVARRQDIYVVAIFSDFSTLSREFYKFSLSRGDYKELLFRPDEQVFFFSTTTQDNCEQLKADFSEARSQMQIEFVPLTRAYNYYQKLPTSRIFDVQPAFRFTASFSGQTVKCSIPAGCTAMNWPIPYDCAGDMVTPVYYCWIGPETLVDMARLKADEYPITGDGLDNITRGRYFVAVKEGGPPFALLSLRTNSATMRILPWGFPRLLDVTADGIPSKIACDAFLRNVPPAYVDRTVQLFGERRWACSAAVIDEMVRIAAAPRRHEREELFKRQDTRASVPVFVDPTRNRCDIVENLMDQVTLAKSEYTLRRTRVPVPVNIDTVDDEKFSSLDFVRSKVWPMKVFDRSQSPVTEDMVRRFLAPVRSQVEEQSTSVAAQVQETATLMVEPTPVGDDTDRFRMLEDLVLLLRDQEIAAVDSRLDEMAGDVELTEFVRSFLMKTVRRFRLEHYLPDAFVAKLAGTAT